MLSAEQIAFFRENGFVQGPRLLDDSQLEAMRDAVTRVLKGESERQAEYTVGLPTKEGQEAKAVTQTLNAWQADRVIRYHILGSRVAEACAQLLDVSQLRLFHDQILIKPPGGGNVVPWHQDYMYWQIVDRPEMITCWMPLDDATEENGCMLFVPRSHTWGLFPTVDFGSDFETLLREANAPVGEKLEIVPLPTKAGHCTFHHALTFHGTSINRTNRPRRAVIGHYMSGACRYRAAGEHYLKKHIQLEDGAEFDDALFPTVLGASDQSAAGGGNLPTPT